MIYIQEYIDIYAYKQMCIKPNGLSLFLKLWCPSPALFAMNLWFQLVILVNHVFYSRENWFLTHHLRWSTQKVPHNVFLQNNAIIMFLTWGGGTKKLGFPTVTDVIDQDNLLKAAGIIDMW